MNTEIHNEKALHKVSISGGNRSSTSLESSSQPGLSSIFGNELNLQRSVTANPYIRSSRAMDDSDQEYGSLYADRPKSVADSNFELQRSYSMMSAGGVGDDLDINFQSLSLKNHRPVTTGGTVSTTNRDSGNFDTSRASRPEETREGSLERLKPQGQNFEQQGYNQPNGQGHRREYGNGMMYGYTVSPAMHAVHLPTYQPVSPGLHGIPVTSSPGLIPIPSPYLSPLSPYRAPAIPNTFVAHSPQVDYSRMVQPINHIPYGMPQPGEEAAMYSHPVSYDSPQVPQSPYMPAASMANSLFTPAQGGIPGLSYTNLSYYNANQPSQADMAAHDQFYATSAMVANNVLLSPAVAPMSPMFAHYVPTNSPVPRPNMPNHSQIYQNAQQQNHAQRHNQPGMNMPAQLQMMPPLPPAAASSGGGGSRSLRQQSSSSVGSTTQTKDPSPSNAEVSSIRGLDSAYSSVGEISASETAASVQRNPVPGLSSGPPVQNPSNMNKTNMLEELRREMKQMPSTNDRSSGRRGNSANNIHNYTTNNVGVLWGLREIKGCVVDFAKDQYGSRFIQSKLEDVRVSSAEKQELFEEVLPHAKTLCKDVFGNYVVQKLLDPRVGTAPQQLKLCDNAIKGNVLDLSTHMYGCRVVQKLVEQIFGARKPTSNSRLYDPDYQDSLLSELISNVGECVRDQNGNHVIQKCIEQVRPISRISPMLDSFTGKYAAMAKHPYGCRVVQRVLENCSQERVGNVLDELINEIRELTSDQYANYVVQHVIQHQQQGTHREALFNVVTKNVLIFSQHKFGSNVVEACLKYGNVPEREGLIEGMLTGDIPPLEVMMKDPYANYVVQKVIDKSNQAQYERVVRLVQANESSLKRLTYGKHILNKIRQH